MLIHGLEKQVNGFVVGIRFHAADSPPFPAAKALGEASNPS